MVAAEPQQLVHVLKLAKGPEVYLFLFRRQTRIQMIRHMMTMAERGDTSLSYHDVLRLTARMVETCNDTQETDTPRHPG